MENEKFIEIKINPKLVSISEEGENELIKFYLNVISFAQEKNIWSDNIEKIIITNDFENDVAEYAQKWDIKFKLTQEREYISISKILFNHDINDPRYMIFFPLYIHQDNKIVLNTIFRQIIFVKSYEYLPDSLIIAPTKEIGSNLDEFIYPLLSNWIANAITEIIFIRTIENRLDNTNHDVFYTSFKRRLKKYLYDYNTDKYENETNLYIFWTNYYGLINDFISRIIENSSGEDIIKLEEKFSNTLYGFIQYIFELAETFLRKNRDYNVSEAIKFIVEFSKHFEIKIEQEADKRFGIYFSQNPKDYFREIVDCEPRIISFLDILGFSDLIEEYNKLNTSTILQDIQKAFNDTVNSFAYLNKLPNQELFKHLEYRLFSDNICISIPYFDNQADFLGNFNIICAFSRGIQFALMSMGFFVRGGISLGSYYSDKNIIFSKGLVNAYLIENKIAKYPRIVIDPIITSKLISYGDGISQKFIITDYLVEDWENTVFLNPFGIIDTTINQVKLIFDSLKSMGNDNLSLLMAQLSDNLSKNILTEFEKSKTEERKNINKIKEYVALNKYKYNSNPNILSKYLWLEEFIKWIDNDDTAKLKFTRFMDN